MPHFKDKTGCLHFLDDAAFAHLLPAGCVPITDAEAEALRPQASAPILVVTPWQIRKALNALDLRTAVETAMEGADQTTQDAWQYATEFVRTDPLVSAFGAVLGKTDEDLDALFALAKTL